METDPTPSETKREPEARGRRPIGWLVIVLLVPILPSLTVVSAIALRITIFEAFELEGPSMEPTLLNGERVVVDKSAYGLFLPFTSEATLSWGAPERGAVVVVKSPHDDIDIMKRVVGIAGDVIRMENDGLIINGEPLSREDLGSCSTCAPGMGTTSAECTRETFGDQSWVVAADPASPPSNQPEMTVPVGHVYLLGDHRDRSNDSRFFGPVPIVKIRGEILGIYFSQDLSRIGWGLP